MQSANNNEFDIWTFAPTLPLDRTLNLSESVVYCGMWFVAWGSLTLALNIRFRHRGDEWVSRVVSAVHSVLSFALCVYAGIVGFPGIHGPFFGEPTKATEQLALGCSIGYFIADTAGMILGSYFEQLFLWHHIASAVALALGHFSSHCGWELCVVLAIMEGSNPFMHVRWLLLQESKPSQTMLNTFTELFFRSFTVLRVLLGTPIMVLQLTSPQEPVLLKVVGFAIMMVSYKIWAEMVAQRRRGELIKI